MVGLDSDAQCFRLMEYLYRDRTGMHADGFDKFLHKHCIDVIKPSNILHIGYSVF